MSRKKSAKGHAKRQATNNSHATIHAMVKAFSEMPATMAAHITKEIALVKQKENKLKAALSKATAQVKHSQQKVKSATGKKQLKTAKKSHAEHSKAQAALTKQWNEIAKSLETLNTEHAKTVALRKHLSQFHKEWAQQVKKLKAKSKSKVKAKTTKIKTKRVASKPKTISPTTEQPRVESYEPMSMDHVRMSDTPELTS